MDERTGRLLALLQTGPMSASALQRELGVSQPTMSRLARKAGDAVLRIGRARASRYAHRRSLGPLGSRWTVYRIDALGHPHLAAHLHAVTPRGWWYAAVGAAPGWLDGEFRDGLFPDLPWFLDDMRPQGFMGRAFARRHAGLLGIGDDPRLWSADATLSALLSFGDDTPGDFILGDSALARFERRRLSAPASIGFGDRASAYAACATAALANEVPGSSAGGEQPKFTATVATAEGYRHVIVKFSPTRDSAVGSRWADLLVCEHLALEALRAGGVAVCHTELLEAGGRAFLEVARFDRVGAHGRRGFVSMLALCSAFDGALDDWPSAAERLEGGGWLSRGDADTLRLLWHFGGFIRNTDMHFGNVTFALEQGTPLGMAPAYDMLPMHYRPTAAGEVVSREFEPRIPPGLRRDIWFRAGRMAERFWALASSDARLSVAFRDEAARVAVLTGRLLATYE
jgi:hypothetical protein